MWSPIFAVEVDVVPGWFSVLLQGGSFAVLVYILIFGLPKMRKEMACERTAELDVRDKAIEKQRDDFLTDVRLQRDRFTTEVKSQREEFTTVVKDLSSTFKTESAAERDACEKHFGTLASAMSKGNEATVAAVRGMMEQAAQQAERSRQHDEKDRQNAEILKALVDKKTKEKEVP